MPSLLEPLMTQTAKSRLQSLKITLPTVATIVGGRPANIAQFLVQDNTGIHAAPSVKPVAPAGAVGGPRTTRQFMAPVPAPAPQTAPSALFRAATNDRADVAFQNEVSTEFANFISKTCHAIVLAHNDWKAKAFLRGVTINGPIATGGSISGPLLSAMIQANAPQTGMFGVAARYSRAIGDGISSCWHEWEQSVRIPGLPWYPAFTAFPGHSAPPTPNVPTPLSALASNPASLTTDALTRAMSQKLGQAAPYSQELFQSIAAATSAALTAWIPTQMITGVMGRGAVSSFAPPYVPVGPVTMGGIVEAPPHFST